VNFPQLSRSSAPSFRRFLETLSAHTLLTNDQEETDCV
jgi:hypothetical protein